MNETTISLRTSSKEKKKELKPHENSLSDTGECREEREQASESLSGVFQMESPIKGIAEEKDK